MPMRIVDCTFSRLDVRLRMPFRYGIATMTEGPMLFVRLGVEIAGRTWMGQASDLLPPKWFTKVPAQPLTEEIGQMLSVIRVAARRAVGLSGANAFELWQQLYGGQMAWATATQVPSLLANFGVSLIERAMIEATARAANAPFAGLVATNALGIRLQAIHPELEGMEPRNALPATPLESVIVRHTVGLTDPLTDEEIRSEDRLTDGLPQSLESNISAYGLRHFKIKVSGVQADDLERLRRVAAVIQSKASADFAITLDGNEQFKSVEAFRQFWESTQAESALRAFFQHLLFVEQPLHRDVALQDEVGMALSQWLNHPPILIDESDGMVEDLRTALRLGYAGTSHKNCKGVFKGLAHRCLIANREKELGARLMMSGEDLCNVGPVALLQDLAVMASLGIRSVERNGHHYHAGLSQFPQPVQAAILSAHPDLYRQMPAGWPSVRIENGSMMLTSVNRAPLGVGFLIEPGWIPALT
jgi:hypothetical protein